MISEPVFREIEFASGDYEEECKLRDDVLRKPLGLSLWEEDLSAESEQLHFGAFDGGELRGCGVVAILSETEAKIRQVAVKSGSQGCGVGSELMRFIESRLRERGLVEVILHSRSSVCRFYRELGYEVKGESFEEVGLLHYRMNRVL